MTYLDITRSRQAARRVGRHQGQCWRNAFIAFREMPGAIYVEGWIILNGLVIEHGWIEYRERIIDPSLYDATPPPAAYFPGFRFDHKQAQALITQTGGKLPFAHEIYHGGGDSPEYKAAFDAARKASDKTKPA